MPDVTTTSALVQPGANLVAVVTETRGSATRTARRPFTVPGSVTVGAPPTSTARFTPSATTRPTRANTGVYDPAGGTWTPAQTLTGDRTLTTDGEVFTDVRFDGVVKVKARNVVFRRCLFTGGSAVVTNNYSGLLCLYDAAQSGALVEDCTISPTNPVQQCRNGITGHDFTARRLRIENVIDCFEVFYNADPGRSDPCGVLIEGCWGGDFTFISSNTQPVALQGWPADKQTHNDWCQWQGGSGLILRYNAMESLAGTYVDDQLGVLPAGRQVLSNMVIKGDVGQIADGDIHDNWCTGGNFAFNIAQNPTYPITSPGSVSNNHFLGGDTAHGRYLVRAISMPASVTSSTTTGNDDGAGNPITVYHNG